MVVRSRTLGYIFTTLRSVAQSESSRAIIWSISGSDNSCIPPATSDTAPAALHRIHEAGDHVGDPLGQFDKVNAGAITYELLIHIHDAAVRHSSPRDNRH